MLRCYCGARRAQSRRVHPQADELGRRVSPGNNLRPPGPAGTFYASCNMGHDQEQDAVILKSPQSEPMRRPGAESQTVRVWVC